MGAGSTPTHLRAEAIPRHRSKNTNKPSFPSPTTRNSRSTKNASALPTLQRKFAKSCWPPQLVSPLIVLLKLKTNPSGIFLDEQSAVHKRALRLSMIQSAQVFSPRPSKDPRENLRILQSPLKQGIFPPQTPRGGQTPTRTRAVSPLKYSSKSGAQSDDSDSDEVEKVDEKEHEEAEEEIVLVATNHPRVVEEESDLVILEDVPFGAVPATALVQAPTPVYGGQDAAAPPPRTPRRKSLGGTALHRAVLIRSAQRAVWRAEKEKEEEEEREEEMEVLGAVVHPVEVDEEEEDYDDEDHDVEMRSVSSDGEGSDEEQDAEALAQKAANKSLWRKSLERIIPWGFGASADEDNEREASIFLVSLNSRYSFCVH